MDGLRALLEAQAGVVTYAQARRAGVPAGQLAAPGERGRLVRIRPDAYTPATQYAQASEAERAALRVAAERLISGVDLVATGLLAAVVHGLPVLGRLPEQLELTERKHERPKHHGNSATIQDRDVTVVRGVPVSSLARTAVDVARTRGFVGGVITADGVLARRVERAEMQEVRSRCRRWPGVATADLVLRFADGRSESALESYGRVRMHQNGLPPPELQVRLFDEAGLMGRVDQCWRHRWTVAEADGAVKYTDPVALFAEKQREDRLREAGFEVVRYTWVDVARRPEALTRRVAAAFGRASRRHAA